MAGLTLQGCKSSTDMKKLTDAAKTDNLKKSTSAEFKTIVEKFQNDVKKVTEQKKTLTKSTKKEWTDLKVDDVCANLKAMNDHFVKKLTTGTDAKDFFDKYTTAVASRWKFFDYATTCKPSVTPSNTAAQLKKAQDKRTQLVADLNKALKTATGTRKADIEKQFKALKKLKDSKDLKALNKAIEAAQEALKTPEQLLQEAQSQFTAALQKLEKMHADEKDTAKKAELKKQVDVFKAFKNTDDFKDLAKLKAELKKLQKVAKTDAEKLADAKKQAEDLVTALKALETKAGVDTQAIKDQIKILQDLKDEKDVKKITKAVKAAQAVKDAQQKNADAAEKLTAAKAKVEQKRFKHVNHDFCLI